MSALKAMTIQLNLQHHALIHAPESFMQGSKAMLTHGAISSANSASSMNAHIGIRDMAYQFMVFDTQSTWVMSLINF
jgi:hypothetical protein